MSLDGAIAALTLLKPVAKLVPGAGTYLEAAVDAALEGCKYANEVKSNKEANHALSERAVRYLTVVVEKAQELPESEVLKRMGTIGELKGLIDELVGIMRLRAQRRLHSRMWHRSDDKKEIDELSKRFDEVIGRFGVQAQLVIMYNLDDAVRRIILLQTTQEQMKETQTKADQIALLDRLRPVMNARHDHPDAPQGCTENTRVEVLNSMFRWALDQLVLQNIFWLSGLAGTGKSAIMKALSYMLAKEGVLGGCFFISIKSADRSNPQNVIRTLAHQLAEFQPILREPICSVIRDCPTIADQEMSLQAPKLLSGIFASALSRIERPIVIMIDALDECKKEDGMEGGELLNILLNVISQHPTKLKLIVTSRLTPTIQGAMSIITAEQLRLHEIENDIVAGDIRLYLKTKFEEITRKRGLGNTPGWYTDEDIDELVRLAGKLFIFAFTIAMWVGNPFYVPKDRLWQIMKMQTLDNTQSLYEPLDSLYDSILQSSLGPNPKERDEIGKRIRRLLELLVVAFKPLLVSELAVILGCDEDLLWIDLGNLSAVLVVPQRGVTEPVTIHHASFVAYVTDELRCSRGSPFYVAVKEAHGQVGALCLDLCYTPGSFNVQSNCKNHDGNIHILPSYIYDQWRSHLKRSSFSPNFVLEAMQKLQQAIDKSSLEVKLLSILSSLLNIQINQSDKIEFFHEKVRVDRQVLQLRRSSQSPEQDEALNNLANGLWSLYQRNSSQEALDEAITLYQEGLELCPPGHPNQDTSLNNLATGLWSLYWQNSSQEVLDEAITLFREGLELCPPGHPT